ncbi:MAG: GNAT family N-acetyltransferase [Rhodobacteraceae bacterium]|nr:GNAT family N-acetyltransferase [Paracoccaceae bacterium]
MAEVKIEEALTPSAVADCIDIRRVVFIDEQGVSEAEEIDGLDDECRHYLLKLDGAPVATARTRMKNDELKIQRVAVRLEGRGQGLGAAVMRHIIQETAHEAPARVLFLSSQTSAIGFYETLGFKAEGPEYLDANIPHQDMRRPAVL